MKKISLFILILLLTGCDSSQEDLIRACGPGNTLHVTVEESTFNSTKSVTCVWTIEEN